MNWKWWLHRVIFLRRWTGCGGEGYYDTGRVTSSGVRVIDLCEKTGCH